MTASGRSLASGFLRSAERFAERPALTAAGETLNYAALRERSACLAATLQRETGSDDPPRTALFASRSPAAFTAVLGALLAGHAYVPLNPAFPASRSRAMLERSGCRLLVVDEAGAAQLQGLLDGLSRELVVILPDEEDVGALALRWPRHRVLGHADLEPAERWRPSLVEPAAPAYLLFTSGSTGLPKGVLVSHGNVLAYVHSMAQRYGVSEEDRLSQTFDLTFDLSVFDMYVGWERGAHLCCPSRAELLTPASYIRDSELTIWFSVPSLAALLKGLGLLEKGVFPGLRASLFCGEALPAEIVQVWRRAAPASIVDNLYGPTELTVSCTAYRWNDASSAGDCENGIVPIGEPNPGMRALVVDEDLREVEPGEIGELILSGPQVTLGYLEDPAATAAAFLVPPGHRELFYRTGDRVRRPEGGAPMTYHGRGDQQVQLRGYRVELGEVEAVLLEEAGAAQVAVVGWPATAGAASGLVGFLATEEADLRAIRTRLRARLPAYMVPGRLEMLERFPLNPNGKIDRRALVERLEADDNGIER